MQNIKDLDRYCGCLVGGAAGDALGYAVEFSSEDAIFSRYGPRGITEYELRGGKALISDDTQMTLFTANGLLLCTTRGMLRGIAGPYESYIGRCYRDWLVTQGQSCPCARGISWLRNIPELNHPRAPGNTCITALMCPELGSTARPINNSKGCGGVMRVAPAGLYLGGGGMSSDEIDRIGAESAALTHGHELGWLPAAMLTHIVNLLAHTDASVSEAVEDAQEALRRVFPNAGYTGELLDLVELAKKLASSSVGDLEAIKAIGGGWVAEETLAIAIFCALRHEDDFEAAIIASVNHGGDSDSTGAVTGNILGAKHGLAGIPEKFRTNLELYDTVIEVADDLCNDCRMTEYGEYRDEVWLRKYVYGTYPN